jgi:hypothetical protein
MAFTSSMPTQIMRMSIRTYLRAPAPIRARIPQINILNVQERIE